MPNFQCISHYCILYCDIPVAPLFLCSTILSPYPLYNSRIFSFYRRQLKHGFKSTQDQTIDAKNCDCPGITSGGCSGIPSCGCSASPCTCSISCGTELILTACSSFLIKSLHQFERWIVYMTLYVPLCNITSWFSNVSVWVCASMCWYDVYATISRVCPNSPINLCFDLHEFSVKTLFNVQ